LQPFATQGFTKGWLTGLEPATSRSTICGLPVTTDNLQGLTSTPSAACTAACTSEGENADAGALEAASLGTSPQAADGPDAHQGDEGKGIDQGRAARGSSAADQNQGDPLAVLAAAVAKLSPADRERLAAMLTGH
jgi:hypothetical protein